MYVWISAIHFVSGAFAISKLAGEQNLTTSFTSRVLKHLLDLFLRDVCFLLVDVSVLVDAVGLIVVRMWMPILNQFRTASTAMIWAVFTHHHKIFICKRFHWNWKMIVQCVKWFLFLKFVVVIWGAHSDSSATALPIMLTIMMSLFLWWEFSFLMSRNFIHAFPLYENCHKPSRWDLHRQCAEN